MTSDRPLQSVATTIQSYELSAQDFRGILQEALRKGARLRFAAAGFSMDPFIKDCDVVTIAPLPSRPRIGQIAAAVSPVNGQVIIHRIVEVRADQARLKGDNAGKADGWIGEQSLLGIVTLVERDGAVQDLGISRQAGLIARLSRYHLLRPLLRLAVAIVPQRYHTTGGRGR